MPVKFPGWSQPWVSGLQAWTEAMRKAKMVMRVVYMVATEWLNEYCVSGMFCGEVARVQDWVATERGSGAVFKDFHYYIMSPNSVSIFALSRS